MTKDLEREIEDRAMNTLRGRGLFAERLHKEGCRGWPDVQVMHGGVCVFVEAKRPGTGRLSAQQIDCHGELRKFGMEVIVSDDEEDIVDKVWAFFENRLGRPGASFCTGRGVR